MQCDEITHTNIENGPLMGGPELFEHKAIIGLKDYGFLLYQLKIHVQVVVIF